jgi:hypothetical protein
LEKACAKVFQGYDNLSKLHILDVMRVLTPAPQHFINHDKVEKSDVWD